ncbi:MAG: glycoside hydrolase family 99-like domain-containing protein [Pirellulales bacterium]|nr:glycoside hydrolase family 99-like domain-containing protein [Pirellulales bacterium]
MGKRILFISHDASRTGAPIILLRMLRWLHANRKASFDVLLRNGGELHDEFAALGDVFDASQPLPHGQDLVAVLGQRDYGLVYSNTVTNGELLQRLTPLDCPVITHIHELEYWIRWETPPAVVEGTRRYSDRFIVVSETVKNNLVENFGVPADRIDVIYGFIPVAEVRRHQHEEAKQMVCRRLGISPSARLVGGCGTSDWRKGPDLMVQAAAAVRRRGFRDPVHFLWIGGESSGPHWGKLIHDAARAGVAENVHFLGVQKDPFPLFASLDIFLLTSREDPFPLVMLENAAVGNPMVCFSGSGGASEFVGDDCGLVVPYLDIEGMAGGVCHLLADDGLRRRMGARAAEKVRAFHDVDVGTTKILEVIERFLPPGSVSDEISEKPIASPPAVPAVEATWERPLSAPEPTAISPPVPERNTIRLETAEFPGMNRPARRLIAFFLPQYHPIPENNHWWGKGFTEWRNVTKARPLFAGHYQPHLPADLGFYDLRVPEVRQAQADLARQYGLDGFCYYHYWFGGRRLLERPFQEVLESGRPDFPFCLCWANENWTRNWDGGHHEALMPQHYSPEDDRRHIEWLLQAFSDPRYIRIGGRPLMLIYRAKHLPNVRQTTEIWREAAAQRGLPGLYLCRIESFTDERDDPAQHGFDAALAFQPDWLQLGQPLNSTSPRKKWFCRSGLGRPGPEGPTVYEYASVVQRMLAKPDVPYRRFPCVMPSWDNTPRRGRDGLVIRNCTPDLYEYWLTEVLRRPAAGAPEENIVFINAWNEWAEGNHLEPDARFGRGYLEATRRALQATRIVCTASDGVRHAAA